MNLETGRGAETTEAGTDCHRGRIPEVAGTGAAGQLAAAVVEVEPVPLLAG